MKAAAVHARSRAYQRALDSAHRVVDRALLGTMRWAIATSGGKDSTLLAHFVTQTAQRHDAEIVTEKDDLDYPGEEAYLRLLAHAWGATLRVVRPAISAAAFMAEQGRSGRHRAADDIHARSAALSRECFYSIIEQATAAYDVVLLGLRAEESGRRKRLRDTRGPVYDLKTGQRRGHPFMDWTGLDIYAYALTQGVPLLPLYQCIAFMHHREPWKVRKSWWLPAGSNTRHGGVSWLRHYYPSLYGLLCTWIPDARTYA